MRFEPDLALRALLALALAFACNSTSSTDTGHSPREVVEGWFRHRADPLRRCALLTESLRREYCPPDSWPPPAPTRLVSVAETTDLNEVTSYLTTGRGSVNGVARDDVRVVRAEFEVRWPEEQEDPSLPDGHYSWKFIVIRAARGARWAIDAWGEI
jgi:hypothetical protein